MAADGNEPVQMKLHKSLRLWTFYVDLEESLGNLESTRAVYERILDLRIATPQIIINYALLLEVWTLLHVFLLHVPFTFSGLCMFTCFYCFMLYRSINTLKMHSEYTKEVSRFLSTLMLKIYGSHTSQSSLRDMGRQNLNGQESCLKMPLKRYALP